MTKASKNHFLKAFGFYSGRCERIRTFDPLHPMQVRYQAAPHTDLAANYNLPMRWAQKGTESRSRISDSSRLTWISLSDGDR